LPITDNRGRHNSHTKIEDVTKNAAREFISAQNARESHYSRNNNPNKLFLPSTYAKAKLYRTFLAQNTQFEPNENNPSRGLTYWYFRKVFNYEFNISAGYPRSDLCNTCELFEKRITVARRENNENVEQLNIEQLRHWDSAETFYEELRRCRELGDEYLIICCDFEKNFNLPITGLNKEYFSSPLNVFNFGVKNLQSGATTMFFYPQNFAKKGSNEVSSMLFWYIQAKRTANTRHLVVFADNSAGQNKNRFVFCLFQHLCNTVFETVTIHFPTPGHSFLPIDREFAILEKKRRKIDRVISSSTWNTLIREAKIQDPFELVFVENAFTDNLQPDQTPIVRVKDFKAVLTPILSHRANLAHLKGIQLTNGLVAMAYENFETGFIEPWNPFLETTTVEMLNHAILNAPMKYNNETYLPVPPNARNDVNELLEYVDIPQNVTYYESII